MRILCGIYILVAGVDAYDIDLVDYSNIDAGIAMKMTGSFVLAERIQCNWEI